MNRREMLQSGMAVIAAVGIDGEVATMTPKNPQAFIIRIPKTIGVDTARRLEHQWQKRFAGTPLEKVPVVVLECGMTLEVIDAP